MDTIPAALRVLKARQVGRCGGDKSGKKVVCLAGLPRFIEIQKVLVQFEQLFFDDFVFFFFF
jgi:hypothetical protein